MGIGRRPMPIIVTTRGTSISIMAMITPTTRTTTIKSGWFAPDSGINAPYFGLQQVEKAYIACRRCKRAKVRTCLYESQLLDNLVSTKNALQNQSWRQQIIDFTQHKLNLKLRDDYVLAPIKNGANFLGYIIRPDYKLVRKRVIGNLHEKLEQFMHQMFNNKKEGTVIDCAPLIIQKLQATLVSYWGHFKHANSYRLKGFIFNKYKYLQLFFNLSTNREKLWPIYQPETIDSFFAQWHFFKQYYSKYNLLLQCGNKVIYSEIKSNKLKASISNFNHPTLHKLLQFPIKQLKQVRQQLEQRGITYVFCSEQGSINGRLKKRAVRLIFQPQKIISSEVTLFTVTS